MLRFKLEVSLTSIEAVAPKNGRSATCGPSCQFPLSAPESACKSGMFTSRPQWKDWDHHGVGLILGTAEAIPYTLRLALYTLNSHS